MLTIAKNLYDYRELMATLAWKNIALRYKQAYLGIAWADYQAAHAHADLHPGEELRRHRQRQHTLPHPHLCRAHALDLLSGICLGWRHQRCRQHRP